MRLGDLDALKEDFKSRLADCNEWIEKAKDKETKIRASAIKAYIGEVIMTIDNAPTAVTYSEEDMCNATSGGYDIGYDMARRLYERPQGELKEYKPFEVDYNVKSAVENLKTAYWSNDAEKYAKAFTEADQMIVSAICHYGYIVVKGGAE